MNYEKSLNQQFGMNASKYVTSMIHAKGEDLQWIIEAVATLNRGSLLDIATGGGHVINACAPYFDHAVALDQTKEMLVVAEEFVKGNSHKHVEFVLGKAEALPFQDEQFDVLTCRIAPHHFQDITQFIKEAYRVVKKNGMFIMIDNVAPEKEDLDHFYNKIEKWRDPSHVRAYKTSEWLTLLESTGFTINHTQTFSKKFDFDDWCQRSLLSQTEKKISLHLY